MSPKELKLFKTTNFASIIAQMFKNFSILKYVTFTALFITAGLAGKIAIPGTQVGITMQTFVLMLIALNLTAAEGVAVISTYITLGALGMPIFSGGMSTLALIGPSAGFIWGFIPAFLIAQYGVRFVNSHTQSTLARALGSFTALALGCMVFLYTCGVSVQSIIVNASWTSLMTASFGFIGFDCIKALAALACTYGVRVLSTRMQRY